MLQLIGVVWSCLALGGNLPTSPCVAPGVINKLAERIGSWRSVHANSDGAETDSLVLECARLLTDDPGGEQAPLWTFGLAAMSEYVAWRPGDGVADVVVDALLAADRALRDRPCGHPGHPYEEVVAELDDDDIWCHGPDLGDLERLRADEEWWCPVNVAGFARITADVIAPFSADELPEDLPRDDESDIKDLDGILNDYPYADPRWTLEYLAGSLPSHPTRGVRAGYVVTMYASCWYAVSGRIRTSSVLDSMIEGLEGVLPQLGDGTCAHAPDEHPKTGFDAAGTAADGIRLRSPGGRACHAAWHDEDRIPVRNWLCPAFLRGLAETALGELRRGRKTLFGSRDTARLDAEFLRPDGRVDIGSLTALIEDNQFDEHRDVQEAGLWAARRYAALAADADPVERTVPLLIATWCVEIVEMPYGVAKDIRDILSTVDADPAEGQCAHGDAHPTESRDLQQHLNHLYAPAEFTEPADVSAPDAWLCPRHLAMAARHAIEEINERFEDEDDYAAEDDPGTTSAD
ncbi:hypothetical protein [Saccharopolyspora shandongensis]|uniref:hypothetical protein n=1 Tax=Saccharopolyspora shandongensis TaxID=418495 RepID=UPI0033FDD01A